MFPFTSYYNSRHKLKASSQKNCIQTNAVFFVLFHRPTGRTNESAILPNQRVITMIYVIDKIMKTDTTQQASCALS